MKQISPRELKAWLDDPARDKPFMLDVREPWEHEAARIEGAQLVTMRELAGRLAEIDG